MNKDLRKANPALDRAVRQDMELFRTITNGGVLVAGHRTYEEIKHLHGGGRAVCRWHPTENPLEKIKRSMRYMSPKIQETNTIWVVGGANTFSALRNEITGNFISSHLPFDNNPADDSKYVWLDSTLLHADAVIFK